MRLFKSKIRQITIVAIIVGIGSFIKCDTTGITFGSNPYEPSPPNILSEKDSLAIRGILNANGLDSMKERDAIELVSSRIVSINLGNKPLSKIVFSKYLDSLEEWPYLNLMNKSIDTMIFPDSVFGSFSIHLDHNNIRAIPDGIANLRGTIWLFINNNEIDMVSTKITQTRIELLNINYNKLCNTTDTIKQWLLNLRTFPDSSWQSTQQCQ